MNNELKISLFNIDDDELSMSAFEVDNEGDMLFGSDDDSPFEGDPNKPDDKDNKADVVDPDKIFDTGNPQGNVGDNNDDNEGKEVPVDTDDKDGDSPNSTHSSAYLKALKIDGVLPDLDDEFIAEANTPEKFAEAIELQVKARLDERQRRINDALENNVPVDQIRSFENTIKYLDGINAESIESDDDDGAKIRQQLIYQDYINRKFSPDRAKKMTEKSFNSGTDIEDAKEALESNKEYFRDEYSTKLEAARSAEVARRAALEKEANNLKKKILDTEKPFGINVDRVTRQKVLDSITKPKHRDGDIVMTDVDKYKRDNPADFEYNMALFYTLTDGFTNIEKLVGSKVKNETKSALRELNRKLQNTPLNENGEVDFNFGIDSNSRKTVTFI